MILLQALRHTESRERPYKDPPADWPAIALLLAVCAGMLGLFFGLLGLGVWKVVEIVGGLFYGGWR